MPQQAPRPRTTQVLAAFRTLAPGQACTASEVVDALTDQGHDFGEVATTAERRIRLVESSLARLTARGDLICDERADGRPTWALDAVPPSVTDAPAQVPEVASAQPGGSTGEIGKALIALVVIMMLATVILLIIAVWPR